MSRSPNRAVASQFLSHHILGAGIPHANGHYQHAAQAEGGSTSAPEAPSAAGNFEAARSREQIDFGIGILPGGCPRSVNNSGNHKAAAYLHDTGHGNFVLAYGALMRYS